jgi:hypothetical protein
MSRERLEPHLQSILESTRGIAFFGTPHNGAGLARWAELVARYVGVVTQTNTELLEVLQRESEVLARIQNGFDGVARSRAAKGQPIEITCFYETLPLPGLGLIVPQHSAILLGFNASIGIHANHRDMTKFYNVEDPGFVAVYRELSRWIKGITKAEAVRENKALVQVSVALEPAEKIVNAAQVTPCK